MTLDELRAIVLTRRMLGHGMESISGTVWVLVPCPHCSSPRAYAALYNSRVHPWECQDCRHVIAEPALLFAAWKSIYSIGHSDWDVVWKDCLERHKDDGR